MQQTWLRSNQRAIAAGFLAPVCLLVVAMVIVVWPATWWIRLLAVLPLGLAVVVAWSLWRLLRQPRLAHENGHLLVYLSNSFQPYRVPIDIVECFFLGQAPSLLPNPAEESRPSRTQAIVIRLSESAADWHQRAVRPELGQWCDGYITVRGTWSEPIKPSLVQQLNAKLVEAHRAQREHKGQVQ